MYVSDITNRSYTGPDFLAMLEKRVRKHIRLQELITLETTYAFDKPQSLAAAYLRHVLTQLFEDRIAFSDQGEVLCTQTLDEWISERVNAIFTQQEFSQNSFRAPLQVLSTKELTIAAQLLGLEGTPPEATHEFVQELHELYPQTKSSFLNSFLYIQQLLEESSNTRP